MGIIYQAEAPIYEEALMGQVEAAREKRAPDLRSLYFSDDTWTVEGDDSYDNAEMRSQTFGQTEVASEFDEAYVESLKDEAPISGIEQTDIHEGLAHDPISNLVNMDREVIALEAGATVAEAVNLMQARNIGALIITDAQKRPVGIFTEFDVLRRVASKVEDMSAVKLAEVMTANPDTLPADAPIAQALHLMSVHNYRHVPITDASGVVIGIISFRDVVHYIERYFDTTNA
jgi:CBS domain-containing protein